MCVNIVTVVSTLTKTPIPGHRNKIYVFMSIAGSLTVIIFLLTKTREMPDPIIYSFPDDTLLEVNGDELCRVFSRQK